MNKAVFLDKDGTLIPDIPYNVNPQLITLQADSVQGLKKLQTDGYLLIIISNQSGIARGIFNENKLHAVKAKLEELFIINGLILSGFYYCPHHPQGSVTAYAIDCDCRKPKPGMILQAAIDYDVDLAESWMMGDILNDVEAGNRAGCKTALINNGNETEWVPGEYRVPTLTCKSINEAADNILKIITNELAGL
jgi:D-glycero-D-manno-heptose 1,7-bisphosphate phosphatase